MSMGGPYVMIGVRQFPSSVFVEQIDSKKISSIRVALLRMISIAKETGNVGVVFSDKESSICAIEQDILLTGARLETTQGGDPASNGVAEQMVQKICDMSRSVLASYPVNVRKLLWSSAMIWSGQKIKDTNIPPFGCEMVARVPPIKKVKKYSNKAEKVVFLYRSNQCRGAMVFGRLYSNKEIRGIVIRRTFRFVTSSERAWIFPRLQSVNLNTMSRRKREVFDIVTENLDVHSVSDDVDLLGL